MAKMFTNMSKAMSKEELVKKHSVMEATADDERTPVVDTESSSFNEGEIIKFDKNLSKFGVRDVRGTRTLVCIVINSDGTDKLLYHSSLNRYIEEAIEADIQGEKAKIIARHQAGRKDFDINGEETMLINVMKLFNKTSDFYKVLIDLEIELKVLKTEVFKVRRFGDDTRTRNQKLINFEFNAADNDEMIDIISKIIFKLESEIKENKEADVKEIKKQVTKDIKG